MRKQKSNIDSLGLDLLDKMLTLNPDDRMTAKEALEHEYFKTEPLPCELSEMPKIEKDCHAFVLNAERRNNLNAMNKDQNNPNANRNNNNPNANRGPSNQNRNYNNQGNRNYNNPNQNQPYHHNRPYHGNQNPNYRYNNRNSSAGHGGSHRNDHHGHGDHSHTSSDKGQKQSTYPIIPSTLPAEKSSLSSNLTSLFKNENAPANQTAAKETKQDTTKAREQNKQPLQNPQEKAKRPENDIFGMDLDSTANKRKTSHDIGEFDQITKKRQVDPIGQNS